LRARLTGQLTPKASLFGEYEQDLLESDQRRAAVGGDLQLLARTRGYLRYEFLSSFAGPYALNDAQQRYALVAGLASEDTRAGTLYSEYRLRDAIDGRTAQAAIGLRNRWTLREGLHLDASAERVSPLKGGGPSQNAAGFGLEYTRPDVWRGTGRIEWHRASGDDQMYGSLGYGHKLARDWAVLGNAWGNVLDKNRIHSRTQFGVAWRQTEENHWNGLARLDSRYDRDLDATGASTRTMVEILSAHANYQPARPFQLRGQAATRFTDALDTKAGTINASMLGLRATWDMSRVLDAGVIGRTLFTDHLGRRQDGLGAEIGITAMRNFRVATGYNWFGYQDGELQGDSRSDAGFYVDFGLKLDEDVFRWLNPPPPSAPPGGKP
jgi:hypothetical protein